MSQDIRYIQRFENFEKSFKLLEDAIKIENPSILEKAGIIQFFETTFELSWKLLKDYLEYQGFIVKSPRDTIKRAYENDLIDNGKTWLEALNDRNLTVHTYDEIVANEVYETIKSKYFILLKELYNTFKDKVCLD